MAQAQNFLKVVVEPEEANIDIVAVHGLNPVNVESHAEMTWTSKETEKLWLRDFLPLRVPNARVMIFGYNSNITFETSIDGVEEQASNLLNRLYSQRKDIPDRPLIFICHSLGGIVVKEALVQAKLNRYYSDIGFATYGIAFFATPHRGGNMVSLGSVASNVARAVVQNPKNNFMEALKGEKSPFAESFVKKFRFLVDQYEILSFYETRPFKKLGSLIVDRQSATLGLSGHRERQIGIDADHSNICKFSSADDAAYIQVADNLEDLIEKALEAKAERDRLADKAPTESDIQACLQYFWFREMDARVSDVKDAADRTCTWLSTHTLYKHWQSSQCSILWIKGNPGTGKSTLMKYALQHKSTDTGITASFFFNRRGFELERTLPGCYRSLLHQLLPHDATQLLDMATIFKERCETRGPCEKAWHWHEAELKAQLSELIRSLSNQSLRIYVDALDEAGESSAVDLVEQLQNLVQEASKSSGTLRVLFACRHYPLISLDGPIIDVRDENSSDIEVYVRQKFEGQSIIPIKAELLIPAILARANGVFQWITLVLPRVFHELRRGKSLESVQRIIRKLPMELQELYKTLLDEVSPEDRSQLLRLFSWVCFAVEPLTVPEMRHAILIDPQISYSTLQEYKDNQDYADTDKDMENRIIDLSKGLLEIRNLSQQSDGTHTLVQNRQRSRPDSEGVFAKLGTQIKDRFLEALGSGILRVPQIVHESVSDFLVHQNGFRTLREDGSSMSVAEANVQLASSCIRYMLLDDIMSGPTEPTKQLFETYPFVMHCVMLWLDYAVEAHKLNAKNGDEKLEEDIAKLFATLDPSLDCVIRLYQSFSREELFENGMSVAHIVCLLGMPGVLRRLLSVKTAHLNSQDDSGWTPLSYAAAIGSPKVVTVLLKYDEDDVIVNSQNKLGRSPLSLAAEWGHEETVRLLLDRKKVNPNRKDRLGRSPLAYAALRGYLPVVKLLVEHHGVNINSKDNDHWTPLVLAISQGQEAVVRYLAARPEVHINSRDLHHSTPLMIAAGRGHAKIVGLLIEREDVKVNDKNDAGSTALRIAVSERYRGIVKVLLSCKDLEVDGEILPGEIALKLAQNFRREDVDPLLYTHLSKSSTWRKILDLVTETRIQQTLLDPKRKEYPLLLGKRRHSAINT